MDVARALGEAGAAEGLCVVADEQTAGRGRLGRAWYSPRGSALYASLLLRPELPAARGGWLSMLAALAVHDGVSALLRAAGFAPAPLTLKWPNDVLWSGRKVAGILMESTLAGEALERVIIGVGLNVNTVFDEAPGDVRARAISLREVVGREIARDQALAAVLAGFETRYAAFRASPASPRDEYARRLSTLGTRVRIARGHETIVGDAVWVDEDGSLRAQTDAGIGSVAFGDVE